MGDSMHPTIVVRRCEAVMGFNWDLIGAVLMKLDIFISFYVYIVPCIVYFNLFACEFLVRMLIEIRKQGAICRS